MKAIFTYPSNSGTSFIDPNYVGDDTVGFQKRIKELVDGTYKPWDGTIPSDTVTNIMSELSKFNDAPWFETSGNNSIFDFWYNPLYTGTVELISSDISSATAVDGQTSNFEFSGNHGFYDTQYLTLSGFDGSLAEYNGNDYYVKKIDADTIQLATDVDLTLPLQFKWIKNTSITDAFIVGGSPVDFDIDTSAINTVTSGLEVVLQGFDGTLAERNGQVFYVQNLTVNDFDLSFDSAGNQPLVYPAPATNQPIESILFTKSDTAFPWADSEVIMTLPSSSGPLPYGAKIDFATNDSTTHSPAGQDNGIWTGINTALSAYANSVSFGNLWTKPVNSSAPYKYKLYSDITLSTKVDWSNLAGWSPNSPSYFPGQLQKDTPVTLELIGDTYTFRYELSGTNGADMTGNNIAYLVNTSAEELNGLGDSNSGGITTWAQRDTGDYYYGYDDLARTELTNLGMNIICASNALITTATDPKLFLPPALQVDDQGNTLTNKDLIIDASKIESYASNGLQLLDTYLTNEDWMTTSATDIVPSADLNAGDATRSTTRTYNGNPIIEIDPTASATINKAYDTSSFTHYKTPYQIYYRGGSLRTRPYNLTTQSSDYSTAAATFFTTLRGKYLIDSTTVIGVPFIMTWGGSAPFGSDTPTVISGDTFWMLPVGYVQDVDSNGDTIAWFSFQTFYTTTDGGVGINTSGLGAGPPTGPMWASSAYQIAETYLEEFYNKTRTPTATTIYSASWVNDYYGTKVSSSTGWTYLETGDLVTFKTTDVNTGVVTNWGEFIVNKHPNNTFYFWETDGNSGWGNNIWSKPGYTVNSPPSSAQATLTIETTHTNILRKSGVNQPYVYTPASTDNKAFVSSKLQTALTAGKVWTNQSGTEYTDVTTYDLNYTYQNSTTGTIKENFQAPTPNIITTLDPVDSTTGTLTISNANYPGTPFPQGKYRLASVSEHMYGNKTYMQRTGASTYVGNARLKSTSAWSAGDNYQQAITQFPVTTISTDATSGYLTSGFTFDSEFPGQFNSDRDIAFEVETVPNTYTPPAPTPAELEDVFDTDDEWEDYGYAGGRKEWPFHVTPSKADIVYNAPTIANMSQSGIKYTRSVGHTDWRLDVAYPPMTHEEFQKFHAIAQAAQGQAMPFFFKLRDKNGGNILWRKFEDTSVSTKTPRFKNPVASGDRLALVEGFESNENNAFLQGEVFIDGNNDNGYVHTVLNQVDANIYGEAKIRTPWPFRSPVNAGDGCYKEPSHIVVTLANDNFEYKVDTAGYYYMSVSFDLDDWK